MPENFTNPPLQEAICEFRFKSENWDQTIPGLLYQLISSEFPKKESVQEGSVEFFLDSRAKQEPKISHSENEFPKFSNEGGNVFAIFRKNLVSVHFIKPYSGWGDFFSKIKLIFDKYNEVAKPDKLERVGLRYVNKLSVPVDNYVFSDYFKIIQSPLEAIIKKEDIVAVQTGVVSNDGDNLIKMQFASLGENNGKVEYILDIDYFSTNPDNTDIDNWLNGAHTKIEDIFLGSIEDKTKTCFN